MIADENELKDASLKDAKKKGLLKSIEGYKKGISSIEDKKKVIKDHKEIDTLLSDGKYIQLLNENKKEIEKLIEKRKNQEKIELIKKKIEKFKNDYYDETNKKWNKKCIDKVEFKSLIDGISNTIFNTYSTKFNEYFGKNMKEYMNNFNCIVPYSINVSNNIFESILGKDDNYKIYKKFNDIYYEIYSYKAPDVPRAQISLSVLPSASVILLTIYVIMILVE